MSHKSTRPKIEIRKDFITSPETVFDAWLDTGMLSQWMFGPGVREEEIIKLETDSKEGGTFSFIVDRNGEEIDHRGTYRKVNRPHHLVFTWGVDVEAGDESVVTVEIEPTEKGSRLTLQHEMDSKWEAYKDRTRKGWTKMLGKLKGIIE